MFTCTSCFDFEVCESVSVVPQRLVVFHRNCSSIIHRFRDNRVFLQTGNDVISISPPEGAAYSFNDGIWKGNNCFLLVFYGYFASIMHRIRVNDVFCQPEMTSWWFLRWGAPYEVFDDGFWKGDPKFMFMLCWHILPIFNCQRVIQPFHFGWDFPTAGEICGVFGENDPKKSNFRKTLV